MIRKSIVTLLTVLLLFASADAYAKDKANPNPAAKRHFKYCLPGWCNQFFGPKYTNEDFADLADKLGCGTDLMVPDTWALLSEYGVVNASHLANMGKNPDDPKGGDYPPFGPAGNNPKYHDLAWNATDKALDQVAKTKSKFLLAFTGMDTNEGKKVQYQRLVAFWTKAPKGKKESLIAKAERLGVTVVVEMLNTKGDPATWKGHPGYLGSSTPDVVEKFIKPVNSKNFGLAFDVYHVEMMGEDPIAMIKKYHRYIKMVHVAGVVRKDKDFGPTNRGELNAKGQVIDYKKVMAALAPYYNGWVDLEYIPNSKDPAVVKANILAAIAICEAGAAQAKSKK